MLLMPSIAGITSIPDDSAPCDLRPLQSNASGWLLRFPVHFMVMLSFFHHRLQNATPTLLYPSNMLTKAVQSHGQMTPEITAAGTKKTSLSGTVRLQSPSFSE